MDVVKGGQHGLAHGEGTGLVGHVLFPDDWCAGVLFQFQIEHRFKRFQQGIQRLFVPAGLQGTVKQLHGGMNGRTKWQGDADALRLAFLDISKAIVEAAIEVSEYLGMTDIKVLTETAQGLISGHDDLLSGAERKRGRPVTGRFPFYDSKRLLSSVMTVSRYRETVN